MSGNVSELKFSVDAIGSNYIAVKSRALRQLTESMLFEDVLHHTREKLENEVVEFIISGLDSVGNQVTYTCTGRVSDSYGRVRINSEILRKTVDQEIEAPSIALFLAETAQLFEPNQEKLSIFIAELNNTVAKDCAAHHFNSSISLDQLRTYDDFESAVIDGHRYHPCYKSRIGFDLLDNCTYGHDFHPSVNLFWIALRKSMACTYASQSIDFEKLIHEEIGEKVFNEFREHIVNNNEQAEDYVFVPVHPWQWREKIQLEYVDEIACNDLIPLGFHPDDYRPQQSTRTLSNQTKQNAYTVKLALSIVNTSADRLLSPHNVANSAPVSDWLNEILQEDDFLKDELDFSFIREVAGVHDNRSHLPQTLKQRRFGMIGAIWRESIYMHLRPGEFAIPATALCFVDAKGQALADNWIENYGLHPWVSKLLEVFLTPFVHLTYAHGIGFEAHAQNTILIFHDGLPLRVAVRDLPGGIRFDRSYLQYPELCPSLDDAPGFRLRPGQRSVLDATAQEVVWYLHDSIFFVHVAEISHFLHSRYGLPETTFWKMAADAILKYQEKFPELHQRFKAFDLFKPEIRISQYSKRKLYDEDTKGAYHYVPNPLNQNNFFKTTAQ